MVSIILPTYNGERFIAGSINSVLFQSYKNWELLVIDDGSTDKTAEIVKEYLKKDDRVKYFKNEKNLGIQKTLNRGLKLAVGEYVARIDDDDRWVDENKLAKQVEFLDNNPDYVLVGTGTIVVDEDEKELYRFVAPQNDNDIRKRILSRNCFTHSSVMFRRDIVIAIGGYDESENTKHSEDYDLWFRVGKVGKFANLPIYAVKFTMHRGSISSENKAVQFKRNIKTARKYRKFYPNYFMASITNIAKLFVFFVFRLFPFPGIKNMIVKKYKEK